MTSKKKDDPIQDFPKSLQDLGSIALLSLTRLGLTIY